MNDGPQISVVLPTFNRLPALRANFPSLQELVGADEIVVVVDGSTDATAEWLRDRGDRRIRIIEQDQKGSPAARNAGVQASRGEWILMTEDDCYLPGEFAVTLLEVARERDAQVVSAPWLSVSGRDQMAGAIDRGRRTAQSRIRLGTHPSVFPTGDYETPFLNGIVLFSRAVFDAVGYDESFGGNAWREETSLFLAAIEAGFRCVLTPRTASFQLGQWDGGQRRSRLAYEAWAIRNNWRFLRAHREALQRLDEIRTPLTAQTAFVSRRLGAVGAGYLRARWAQRGRGRRTGEPVAPDVG